MTKPARSFCPSHRPQTCDIHQDGSLSTDRLGLLYRFHVISGLEPVTRARTTNPPLFTTSLERRVPVKSHNHLRQTTKPADRTIVMIVCAVSLQAQLMCRIEGASNHVVTSVLGERDGSGGQNF